MARSAICLVVLIAAFELGSCLRCFQCNSQADPNCADPFRGNLPLVECNTQDSINYNRNNLLHAFPNLHDGIPNSPRYCHKLTMQTGTIVRTCLDANPSDVNYSCRLLQSSNYGDSSRQLRECNACDRDGCNGAGSISASLPLAAIAAVIAYLYCKQ